MGLRGPYHTHMGQEHRETVQYFPERQPNFSKRDNPHGYKCSWCGGTIHWTYRNNELWKAPRFYCDDNWICQRVYEHRSAGIESAELHATREWGSFAR